MKRIFLLLLILVAILGIFFFIKKDSYTTVEADEIEFAVKDVSIITRIEMRNRDGKHVTLEKKNNEWWVNDKFPAFEPAVDRFLNQTISKIEVKGPVPAAAQQNVIRQMLSSAIKVSIYSGKKLLRNYYVGAADATQSGTYMWVEHAETPFIAYIPGMDGFLTPQYHIIEDDWYNRTIFDFEADEIKSIDVIYTKKPEESFFISMEHGSYRISPGIAGEQVNQSAARSYFSLFKFKNFEGYPDYLNKETLDSIRTSVPMIRLILTPVKGDKIELKVYPKGRQNDQTVVDNKGNILAYDVERYFAQFTGFPKLVTIQEFVFGNIFANRSDFYKE